MNDQTITLSENEYVEMRAAMLTAIGVLNVVGNHIEAGSHAQVLHDIDIRWDAEYEARTRS